MESQAKETNSNWASNRLEAERILKAASGFVWESTSNWGIQTFRTKHLFVFFSFASCSNFIRLRGGRAETQQSANWLRKCTFFCLFAANMQNTVTQKRTPRPAAPWWHMWSIVIYQNTCRLQKKKKIWRRSWMNLSNSRRQWGVVFLYNASDGRLFWQMKALKTWVLRVMWHVPTTKFHHITSHERKVSRLVFYYCYFPK